MSNPDSRLRPRDRKVSTASRINLYRTPEDMPAWEAAERLAAHTHVSLSSLVAAALEDYLRGKNLKEK